MKNLYENQQQKSVAPVETLLKNLLSRTKPDQLAAIHAVLELLQIQPQELLTSSPTHTDVLPVSLFHPKLGFLEAIVKYLHEAKNSSFVQIAHLLNRDQRVIWLSYRNAKRKVPERWALCASQYVIPLSLFEQNSLSIQECIVVYLHDVLHLRFAEIAELLHRNYQTIWTAYSHGTKKKKQ